MHGLDHGCDKDPLIVSQVSTSQVSDHVLTELTMPATYPLTCVGALQRDSSPNWMYMYVTQ